MKIELKRSNQFRRDYKRCKQRGLNTADLRVVVGILLTPAPLPSVYCDHPLKGDRAGWRECHIAPDWLLIYRYNGAVLELDRTGTHTDLFR